MKKIRKILLIILILISVNIIFMPKRVEAGVWDNVAEYMNNFSNNGSSFWNNLGITLGEILSKFSWLNGIAWLIYFSVAIIALVKWVWPAAKAIMSGNRKSYYLNALVIYVVYVIGGIIICLEIYPLIITEL